MPRPEVADAVHAICESVLAARDVELVTFVLGREPVGQTLRVTVDGRSGPVSLDEIVEISEEISRALDEQDPIPGRYVLEVASAGIERPLVRPADYSRFQGRRIKVRCEEPIEGQKVFTGTIRSSGEATFVLVQDAPAGVVVEIPYSGVAKANLVADWKKELKGLGDVGSPDHTAEIGGGEP